MSADEPKVGIFPSVSWETYSSWHALRSSYLRHFERSPAHARAALLEPQDPTREMDLGTALHCAILEPHAFESRYVLGLEHPRRSNAEKAAHAAFEAEHAGKGILKHDEWATVERVREAIWKQPWAPELLGGKGANELSAVWKDAELGALCKLRIDRYTGSFEGFPMLVDLKSCRDASKPAFQRSIVNYGYDLQSALYLDGLGTVQPHPRRFCWVAFEKEPPYAAAVYEPDDACLERGRTLYKRAIAQHLECTRTGIWHGYPTHVQVIGLPPWAARKPQGEATDVDDAF